MPTIRRGEDGSILAFKCRSCDAWHEGPIESLGADAPDFVAGMSEEDREEHLTLTGEQCILEWEGRTEFVIRGCLQLPVVDVPGPFTFGVWASLSEEDFARTNELWETQGRESEPPYFGWLCTRIPGYPDTLSLKTWVQTRPVGERPLVTVFEPTDHPLFLEQRDGVTVERLVALIEAALH